MKPQGKFITLYGINNIGKSTQAKRLVARLEAAGHSTLYLKYPIYDLEPSGPMINEYLRGGNPHNLSPLEIQLLYTLNRTQYESIIDEKLTSGVWVVAEDYKGTGWAWGIGTGIPKDIILRINNHLRNPDVEILLDGDPFGTNRETNHKYESNDDLLSRVRQIHRELGLEFGWKLVPAAGSIEDVGDAIYGFVQKLF